MQPVSPEPQGDKFHSADASTEMSESAVEPSVESSPPNPSQTSAPLPENSMPENSMPESSLPENSMPENSMRDSPGNFPTVPSQAEALTTLQRRYVDQLSGEIKSLEDEKVQLQHEVAELRAACDRLQAQREALRRSVRIAQQSLTQQPNPLVNQPLRKVEPPAGPRLPGEPPIGLSEVVNQDRSPDRTPDRTLELPTPATSEQRLHTSIQLREPAAIVRVTPRKGLILSAIAMVFLAWQFALVGTLLKGGSWLGISIGQLGQGFVPAVALLWLRMVILLPAMALLAPQIYRYTWEDLQNWLDNQDRLVTLLIASGLALFFSQVLIYQFIGQSGSAVGAALLFLYPLTAVPLGRLFLQGRRMTLFVGLALVALAMGAILMLYPLLGKLPLATVGMGLLASIAFSAYILLTNWSFRQQCHPMPVGIVQFATVAVLSSLVLLVKPLKPVSMSWAGLCVWGLLLGAVMLVVYLFNYASLRLIGPRTVVVAALTPLATLVLAWSFVPRPSLVIIQWTGILLITLGGVALGLEKLSDRD